jgi:3-methyl-2-oxobutanoate hydroxymethyltransferase
VRRTLNDILDLYHKKTKIAVITAHDYITGRMADDAEADMVLVGDSLAMVALGYEDTNELPFDEFLYHCRAVSRGVDTSFLVADLPFGSYESSTSKAIESSIQLISKGRVNAIKLEGGTEITPTIKQLTQLGIPVMGHVGLTPQRSNALSGFKVQGKSVESAERIIEDALRVQEAGAFSVLLEAIPHELGSIITDKLSIPTIGIGAGPQTSGQVLVQADLLGFYPGHTPKFVKKYMEGHGLCVSAMMKYVEEVKGGIFPEIGKNTYKFKQGILDELVKKSMK